ncbi:DUF2142 domain-containing protein [Actinospongicola halichondriae]|uniref:DUF2142 domain-containing protein n=1 Tax=Actinospongicola halichondriae TaxID=3236844 RepID=UPI003D3A4B4A
MTAPREPLGGRRWWLVFACLVVISGAWSLASPPQSGHDEHSHAVRAAGAARGQLLGPEAIDPFPVMYTQMIAVDVPEAYMLPSDCFRARPDVLPSCAPEFAGGDQLVPGFTYQFRSPPWWYVAVGLPTLVDPGLTGYLLMRLLGVALCMAVLTSALASASRFRRPRLGIAAVMLATTPEVLYLTAHINTNGIEIIAATGLWASLLVMVRAPDAVSARLVTRAGVALTVLVGARGLSVPFAAGIVAVACLIGGWRNSRQLWRRRDVRAWTIVGLLVAGVSLVYVDHVRRWLPIHRPGQGIGDAVGRLPWYLEQAVGVFGSNEVRLPAAVLLVWVAGLLALMGIAVRRGDRRATALALAVLAAGILVQVGAEGFAVPPIGFFWQGRYALPILVGGPILAAAGLPARDVGRSTASDDRRLDLGVVVMVAVASGWIVSFAAAIRRYAVGTSGSSSPAKFLVDARWSPATGPVVIHLVVAVAAVSALLAVLVRWTGPDADARPQRSLSSATS